MLHAFTALLRRSPILVATAAIVLAAALMAAPTAAQANSKYAGIVVDANSGKTLYAYRADSRRFPASLTKIMTVYMMFEAMDQGKLDNNTRIRISRHAASMVPTKLGIRAGGSIRAEDAILALITKSANDVAAAVAEHLGGTESQFAQMMTRKARQLGMKSTTFRNASGLPNSKQFTTARDMARLGIAIQEHFPRRFRYFKTRSFRYAGTRIPNHNRLLGRVRGVDGIKTGYTRASGFNLVTSVNAGGRSIVAVVMGGRTGASRNAQMEKLIARYLPDGSRRDRGPLIARNGSSDFATRGPSIASIPLDRLPVPAFGDQPDVIVAAAQPVPVPVPAPMAPRAPAAALPVMAYAPAQRPSAAVDAIITASAAPRSDWIIQIAALPTRDDALGYLRTAQARAGSALSGRQPFVEPFARGGVTYHRARFAGFASKDQAWDTCGALEKLNYSCLAYQR